MATSKAEGVKVRLITLAAFPYSSAESVHLAMFSQAMDAVCDFKLVTPVKPWRLSTWERNLEKIYGISNNAFCLDTSLQLERGGFRFLRRAIRRAKQEGAIAYLRQESAVWMAIEEDCSFAWEMHSLQQSAPKAVAAALQSGALRSIFVISQSLKDDLLVALGTQAEDAAARIFVAPDAANHLMFEDSLSTAATRRAGYIGSAYPGKGVEIVLPLAERCPEFNFILYGPSSNEPVVRAFDARITSNVEFKGRVPYSTIPSAMREFDIALLPNQPDVIMPSGENIGRYTSPMKLFEYMASAKAIIASDLPVIREVLENKETAMLVPHNDIDAWVEAVGELRSNDLLRARISQNARKVFLEKYTYAARAKRVIKELLVGA